MKSNDIMLLSLPVDRATFAEFERICEARGYSANSYIREMMQFTVQMLGTIYGSDTDVKKRTGSVGRAL